MQGWTRRALLKTASAAAIGAGLPSSVRAFGESQEESKRPKPADRRFRSAARSSDNPAYLAGFERTCDGMRIAGVPKA